MLNPAELTKRLNESVSKRKQLKSVTNSLRLVNGQGDSLDGLVIEQYNHHFVIHLYKKGWERLLPIIQTWLEQFGPEFIILKHRISPDGRILDNPKAEILINRSGSKTVVNEYDIKFSVDLNDTVNSGLFLDMRHNRRMVAQYSQGKKVLNCFAYTCSFGVHCRLSRATSVQNVDVNAKVLKKGEKNYFLNNIQPGEREFVRMDSLIFMGKALKHKNFYDLIIIDPPSFARTQGRVFQIAKDLPKLLEMSFKILKPQGMLFVSTNYSSLSAQNLKSVLLKSAKTNLKVLKSISSSGQDVDFPASGSIKESYLAAFFAKIA